MYTAARVRPPHARPCWNMLGCHQPSPPLPHLVLRHHPHPASLFFTHLPGSPWQAAPPRKLPSPASPSQRPGLHCQHLRGTRGPAATRTRGHCITGIRGWGSAGKGKLGVCFRVALAWETMQERGVLAHEEELRLGGDTGVRVTTNPKPRLARPMPGATRQLADPTPHASSNPTPANPSPGRPMPPAAYTRVCCWAHPHHDYCPSYT